MELQFPSLPLLFSFLLFLFMLVKIVSRAKNSAKNLPPGPRQLPIIGNMHQLVGGLTHHILRDLAKKYGPVMHLQFGGISTVVVSSPESAKGALKTHDLIFASRPYLLASQILNYNATDIAFAPYGEYWRQVRKICTVEVLSAKRVQTFRSVREEEVTDLIRAVYSSARAPMNLSKRVFGLTNAITTRAAFGKKGKDQDTFTNLMDAAVKLEAGFNIADMYPSVKFLEVITGVRYKLEKLHKQIDVILETIVSEHREKKIQNGKDEAAEDLVDVLLRIQKQDELSFPLTDDNIKSVVLDIFSGGTETSSTILEWALSELLKNPSAMKKAQDEVRQAFGEGRKVEEKGLHELKYLEAVIKETLRLHPSVPLLLPRECSKECELGGYTIPVKTRLVVNAWAINRDPNYWPEPEIFKPERFLDSALDYRGTVFEYIPFGAGRRMCPGVSFALPNIELPLSHLLYHFDWELAGGVKHEDLDMTDTFGLTIRRKEDLHVIPIPHYPSLVV